MWTTVTERKNYHAALDLFRDFHEDINLPLIFCLQAWRLNMDTPDYNAGFIVSCKKSSNSIASQPQRDF